MRNHGKSLFVIFPWKAGKMRTPGMYFAVVHLACSSDLLPTDRERMHELKQQAVVRNPQDQGDQITCRMCYG
jgi:hypothetical protein